MDHNKYTFRARKPKNVRSLGYVTGVDEFLDANRSILSNEHDDAPHMLAAYLRQQMRERGWKPEDLARELGVLEADGYINYLLDARIPQSKIDRYLLHTIADIFDADEHFVFSLVGRKVYSEDNREQMIEAQHDLSEYVLTEISNVLLTTIDGAYDAKDTPRQELYDRVLKELHNIIARQRRDLKFVQMLINSLDNPELIQTFSTSLDELTDLTAIAERAGFDGMAATSPAPQSTPTPMPNKELALVKTHLRRIVTYFEDRVG